MFREFPVDQIQHERSDIPNAFLLPCPRAGVGCDSKKLSMPGTERKSLNMATIQPT